MYPPAVKPVTTATPLLSVITFTIVVPFVPLELPSEIMLIEKFAPARGSPVSESTFLITIELLATFSTVISLFSPAFK